MKTDSALFESSERRKMLTRLQIRRAIAQAQDTCHSQGQQSRACELTWDHALKLQLDQFHQVQKDQGSRP